MKCDEIVSIFLSSFSIPSTCSLSLSVASLFLFSFLLSLLSSLLSSFSPPFSYFISPFQSLLLFSLLLSLCPSFLFFTPLSIVLRFNPHFFPFLRHFIQLN